MRSPESLGFHDAFFRKHAIWLSSLLRGFAGHLVGSAAAPVVGSAAARSGLECCSSRTSTKLTPVAAQVSITTASRANPAKSPTLSCVALWYRPRHRVTPPRQEEETSHNRKTSSSINQGASHTISEKLLFRFPPLLGTNALEHTQPHGLMLQWWKKRFNAYLQAGDPLGKDYSSPPRPQRSSCFDAFMASTTVRNAARDSFMRCTSRAQIL